MKAVKLINTKLGSVLFCTMIEERLITHGEVLLLSLAIMHNDSEE